MAQSLAAESAQVIFTSSGTEANNHVLLSHYFAAQREKRDLHLVISSIEHACVRNTAEFIQSLGGKISVCPVDEQGIVSLDRLKAICESGPVDLISIMLANNEVGTIQPVSEIVSLANTYGIPVHTDAVQAFGKIPLSFSKLGVDFMTISGHKIGAPKGIGGLIAKQPNSLLPLLHGGAQEKGHRAGTENTLSIIGLGIACANLQDNSMTNEGIEWLWQELQKKIPTSVRNGDPKNTLPNTLNVSFPGVSAQAIVRNLDLEGIAISTGSACSTGSINPSHVLEAMGFPPERTTSAIRLSLGPATTKKDLETTIEALSRIILRLQA